MQGTVSAACL